MATANDLAVLNHILNPLMPTDVSGTNTTIEDDAPIDHIGIESSRLLESDGVKKAETGHIGEAIEIFNKAIEECPINPSAYNNRAQAYRLQGKIDDALQDVEKAISLSGGKGKSACQAFVQRGSIRRLQGNDDKAREDFERAAALGSSFAKMQVVALNPYAAMCNKMLSEVFQGLRKCE